jgi:serine/threonine protein kinase
VSSRILDVGSEIAGYRIESVIGRGGMGVVYLADHLRLKRKVALKVLAPELSADERFRDRFIKESELAASLEEPNIVPIYDAGEAEGHLYIAMRYVQGTDLKALIDEEGALDPTRAATIVSQVASALDAAHDKGLVHRDVKPANVLLDRGDRAYLTDFGLTKRRESVSGLTKTGQFLGTVDYAAPEQFEGKPLDRRADVYSLGCVAFECLTGRVPYPRETEVAAMFAHIKDPVPAPSALRPELGRGVDAVLARAMAKSPDRRPPTAGAFADDLREAVRPGPSTEGRPGRPRSNRRRTRVLLGTGLAAIVAVILVVVAVTGGGGDPDGPGSTSTSSPSGSPSTAVVGSGANARIDPETNSVVARTGSTGFVAVGGGFVWISSENGLQKVSPQNNKVIGTIPLAPDDMTFGDGYLWATSSRTSGIPAHDAPVTDSLYRTDPRTNRISKVATLPERVVQNFSLFIHSMAVGAGSVWVAIQATTGEDLLLGYDERTGDEVDRIRLSEPAAGIAFGEGSLWIRYNGLAPRIDRIDPQTGKVVKRIEVSAADGLAVGAGAVWVSDSSNDVVIKIDPATNTLAGQISRGFDSPQDIAVGPDRVWVLNVNSCTAARIDPGTSRVVATVPLPIRQVATIADGPEGVWVGGLRPGPIGCGGGT